MPSSNSPCCSGRTHWPSLGLLPWRRPSPPTDWQWSCTATRRRRSSSSTSSSLPWWSVTRCVRPQCSSPNPTYPIPALELTHVLLLLLVGTPDRSRLCQGALPPRRGSSSTPGTALNATTAWRACLHAIDGARVLYPMHRCTQRL